MSDTNLRTFPCDEREALAMLYVQNQDLTVLTPEEIYDKYCDAYEKIKNHAREQYKAKKLARRSTSI